MNLAPHAQSSFVHVNGVRLHYLDWGGSGPALIFLAGYGNTPHFFNALARAFTDQFRILGLTRRAHGESEQPESGYDLDTLAADVVSFMDALDIDKATLAGHSFAGMEMATLAVKHPERLKKLVFLDALYEYEQSDIELFGANPVPPAAPPPESFASVADFCEDFVNRYTTYKPLRSPRWDELWGLTLDQREDGQYIEKIRPETAKQLFQGTAGFHADLPAFCCPTLAFFAYQTADWSMPVSASEELREQVIAYTERMNREYKDRNVDRARNEIADVEVVVYEDTSHYCFLDREADVTAVMKAFLL
ncbi:alpha/beta hydrolase [Candidatus Bipolaricaulota bacterium]|nr:alpha/beta hydrolase [Candidatus Bipolaricaulota bacterium]